MSELIIKTEKIKFEKKIKREFSKILYWFLVIVTCGLFYLMELNGYTMIKAYGNDKLLRPTMDKMFSRISDKVNSNRVDRAEVTMFINDLKKRGVHFSIYIEEFEHFRNVQVWHDRHDNIYKTFYL